MSRYGRTECIPGTRLDLIKFATEWVLDPSTNERVLWFHGVAGSGKSTLSTTLASLFQEMHRLGAFVFFNRGVAERNNPEPVIRTLSYHLARFDPRIGRAVATVIDTIPDIVQSPSRMQFLKLVVEPLGSVEGLQSEGPIVIILDALDECGKPEERKELLNTLANLTSSLASIVRIIILSRPEHDIQRHLERDHIRAQKLNINSDNTKHDIKLFVCQRMSDIRNANLDLRLPHDWPGRIKILALVDKASGLFVWASTACNFIDTYNPEKQLEVILQAGKANNAESALDHLYITALKSAGDIWSNIDFSADFRSIMGLILVARDTLSVSSLEKLLRLEDNKPLSHALRRLACVLYYNAAIRILHPSFGDFLSSRERCQSDAWYIDMVSYNCRAASQCLNHLDAHLQYNVCNLPYPATSNIDSWNTIAQLPGDIAYACVYWVDHICGLQDASAAGEWLETFLFRHMLHWIEAMTILKKIKSAIRMMQTLIDWIDVRFLLCDFVKS